MAVAPPSTAASPLSFLLSYGKGSTACHTPGARFIRFALQADFYSPLVALISFRLTLFFFTASRPLEESHPCNCARARACSDVKVRALGSLWRERSQHSSLGPLGPTNLRHYGLSSPPLSPLPTTYWQPALLSRAGIRPRGEPSRREELYAGNISAGLSTLRLPQGRTLGPLGLTAQKWPSRWAM